MWKTTFKFFEGVWSAHTPSNFLKAVFHKFCLVHFWILCPICTYSEGIKLQKIGISWKVTLLKSGKVQKIIRKYQKTLEITRVSMFVSVWESYFCYPPTVLWLLSVFEEYHTEENVELNNSHLYRAMFFVQLNKTKFEKLLSVYTCYKG